MKASWPVIAIAAVLCCSIAALVAYPLHFALAAQAPPTPGAQFTTAEVIFYTTNEDKDPDTEVELFVYRNNGEQAKAYLDIGGGINPHVPNSGFPDNKPSPIYHLPPAAGGFTYGELPQMHFKVHPHPHNNDVWKFRLEVMMHFSDGTRAWMNRDEAMVGTVHAHGITDAIWPLGDLTINPPCTVRTALCVGP
jgi:hypothetical protein